MTQDFPLAPLQRMAWAFPVALALAVIVAVPIWARPDPLPGHAWSVVMFFVALLVVGPMLALRRRRIAVDGRELVVAATLYTQRINVDALDLAQARVVDLAEHTGFAPMLGINRMGLPGFRAGHYILRNRSRAFCLLTRRDRVLVLPRRNGKLILLSPDDPQALLAKLREPALAPSRR